MPTSTLNFVIKLSLILLIGIFSSIFAANREDTGKDRNDTAVYAAHYYCISSSRSIDQCRNEIGGSQYEFIYEQLIKFLTINLNLDRFHYIKLATSALIYLSILISVGLRSRNTTLSLLILLLDFRFWEYGSNVLRHGLAAAFTAISLLLLSKNRPRLSLFTKLLAIFSHLSAATILYTPYKKYKFSTLACLLFISAIILLTSEIWIPALLATNFLDYKIYYYIRNNDGYNFSIPIHYAAFIFSGLIIYRKTKSKLFINTFNHLIPLLFASIVLGYLDASYRMTSFMLPIIAVIIPDQISMAAEKFKEKELIEKLGAGIVGALVIIIAYRNWDFFLIHLK